MPRVAVNVDAIVEDFFSDPCFPVFRRVRTAAFIGAAGIEAEAEQVVGGLGFEDDGVGAGVEQTRVFGGDGFLNGFSANAGRIQLGDVKVVAENYPELRATENFQQLSRNLSELEDEIQASRRIYNSNVQSYNTDIEQFPGSIVANQGHFTKREFFEIEDPGDREPVAVSFDK